MRSDPVQRNVFLNRVAVAVVLLSIVTAPALSAAPRSDDAPRLVAGSAPVAWLGQWLGGLAAGLESVWQRASCRIDPDGAACAEESTETTTSAPEADILNSPQSTDDYGR